MRLRPASPADVDSLVDEPAFRSSYATWSAAHLSDTSVIVVDDQPAGRLLLDELKQESAAARTPIELTVEHDNPRARDFYEREGFRLVGSTDTEHVLRWP